MVEQKLPKLTTRVRFPSPAPPSSRSSAFRTSAFAPGRLLERLGGGVEGGLVQCVDGVYGRVERFRRRLEDVGQQEILQVQADLTAFVAGMDDMQVNPCASARAS
jgi:hypothetical protein